MTGPLRRISRLVFTRSERLAHTLEGMTVALAHEWLWRAAVEQIRTDGSIRLPRVRVALTNAELVLVESWQDKRRAPS